MTIQLLQNQFVFFSFYWRIHLNKITFWHLGHTITMEEFLRTMSIFWTKKLWHTRGWLCLKLHEFLHLESHTTVVLFMQSIFEEKNRISEYFHKTKPSLETQNNNTVSGQRKPISCFIYRLCPMSTSSWLSVTNLLIYEDDSHVGYNAV